MCFLDNPLRKKKNNLIHTIVRCCYLNVIDPGTVPQYVDAQVPRMRRQQRGQWPDPWTRATHQIPPPHTPLPTHACCISHAWLTTSTSYVKQASRILLSGSGPDWVVSEKWPVFVRSGKWQILRLVGFIVIASFWFFGFWLCILTIQMGRCLLSKAAWKEIVLCWYLIVNCYFTYSGSSKIHWYFTVISTVITLQWQVNWG